MGLKNHMQNILISLIQMQLNMYQQPQLHTGFFPFISHSSLTFKNPFYLYSRTIQSIYSFLFGLVGSKTFLNINLQKKSDVTFCFKNCRCEAANRFEKLY